MSSTSAPTPPRRKGHTRSISNPFPSPFAGIGIGLGKRRKSASKNNDDFLDSDDDDDVTYPLPEVGGNNSGTSPGKKSAVGQAQGQGQDGEVTGRCATCDSTVRWPRGLAVFRCPVCSMINDLEPYVEEDRVRGGNGSANGSGSGNGKAAARITRKGSLPDRLVDDADDA